MECGALANMTKSALFLDLDHTLVLVSTERAFMTELYRSEHFSFRTMAMVTGVFLLATLGLISDPAKVKRRLCRPLLREQPVELVLKLYRQVYSDRLRLLLHPALVALSAQFRARNQPVFIISAAFDFVVEPFAAAIQADGYFGTELIQEDGRFTGELGEAILFGEEKVRVMHRIALQHGLDLSACTACSDSVSDVPMLSAVGHPKAVRPCRRLRKHALRRGWEILM